MTEINTVVTNNNYSDLGYVPQSVKQDTCTYLNTNQFVIDGGYTYESVSWVESTGDLNITGSGTSSVLPLIRFQSGIMDLTNVTIQNTMCGGNAGVYMMTSSGTNKNATLKMTHCWLHHLAGAAYPGVAIQFTPGKTQGTGIVEINRCRFSTILSTGSAGMEAAIRSVSGSTATMSIDSCVIYKNFGGGVRWQSLNTDPADISKTIIKQNYSKNNGGGINAKAAITLSSCRIIGNKARVNGGGINYISFDEAGQSVDQAGVVNVRHIKLDMDESTIIDGNEALTGDGGGIFIRGILINMTAQGEGNYPTYNGYDENGEPSPFTLSVEQNGATISNNKAQRDGGGIYISRDDNASFYPIKCRLTSGTIYKNKALTGNGGGVCINQTGTPSGTSSDHSAERIEVYTGGGSANMTINENDAYLDGGGIYLYSINDGTGWSDHMKFQTIVELRDRTKILSNTSYLTVPGNLSSNEANNHGGGGLFVQEGNVTIAGTAAAGDANNPLIEENSTKYSGAGICLIKGNIIANYSRVYSNQTNQTGGTGRGGGVFLKEGNITLNHSKIHNNTSNYYGGGIYCLGTISSSKVELTDSEVKGNVANQHGGGIFLFEGTINVNNSTIGGSNADGNVAGPISNSSSSGDYKGGGIYTQSGNVNINGSTISYNFANRRGGGIYTKSGPVTIKSSVISHNQAGYHKNASGGVENGSTAGTGGGVHTDGGLVTINPNEDEATQTQIINNKARLNGGGIFTGKDGGTKGKVAVYGNRESEGGHLINITGNEALNGSGGGIFCLGDSDGQRYVLLRRVNLSENKATNGTGNQSEFGSYTGLASGCGGGLYLYEGLIDMNLCTVESNTAKKNGGGVNNHQGNINVQSCYIRNNEAGKSNDADEGSGGGIYTHSGTIGVNYWGTPATIQNEARRTEITGNKAKLNGGGLNTHNGKILVQGNSDASTDRILINNNTATKGSGGGIFCMGQPTASGTTGHTNFITLKYVDMKRNKASEGTESYTDSDNGETISKGCGGAVYLQLGEIKATDVVMQNNFAHVNGGAINNHKGFVDIYGCIIGGTNYYDGTTLDGRGNKAENSGGGIYTVEGDIDVEDYIEHSNGSAKRYESKLDYNWAEENGGALNTHSGTIYVNRNERDDETEITYNKAKKGGGIYANEGTIFVNNTRVDNNIATENGGGVNNHAGDITFRGGTLNNNTAQKGRGGGAFTYVGDVNILPFPSTKTSPTRDDGTKVFNNLAQINGGGINNHTGRVDIRHATLRNNTATLGNGGGIFCEGPHSNSTGYTIRMLDSELMENKTCGQDGTPADPTGRGGGIYLKYGSIYAHASDIVENFANVNGGGLDNHDGSILVYGCNIIGNEAVTGRGGGIYTQTGNITTGPASSKATVIHSNIAKINGGGINNHHGDIFLNGDLIFNNEADSCGGGIYIKNGTIEMYGGKIANNTAGVDGGGVWSGGGTFAIQQRVGKPVVDIIDVNVVSGTQAIVHYHIIDNGSGTISSSGHGILYGSSEDAVAAATGAVSGSVYSINSGQEQGADAGCYRITINDNEHFTAGGTYYVKAFTTNSTPLTDYSDVIAFTTYNSSPVVITGSVSNITSTGAEANGKVLYAGTGTNTTIKAQGIQVWKKYKKNSNNEYVEYTPTASDLRPAADLSEFFTVQLSGLTADTIYCMRAYATNVESPTYPTSYSFGEIEEFWTLKNVPDLNGNKVNVTGITNTKASFSFNIPAQSQKVKAYGFIWSTDDDPVLSEDNAKVWTTEIAANTPKAISLDTTNFTPATHYYVRAFATFEEYDGGADPGQYALSEPVDFYTKDANGLPVVRLLSLSNITQNSVTYTAKLIDQGSGAITRYGLCYSTSNMLPTEHGTECDHDEHDGTLAVGQEFTFTITGLDLNQTYYLRAFATNKSLTPEPGDEDYGYSNEFSFTTLPAAEPFVLITSVNPISQTAATVNCSVDNGGGGDITDWGIKYSATDNIADAIDINKPGGGTTLSGNTFSANLPKAEMPALTANTDYYLWAYATNSVGTHTTSHWTRFRTTYDIPTVTNVTVSEIAYNADEDAGQQNTARFAATATPSGSPVINIKTCGVCWSTNPDPVRMTSDYTDSRFVEATDNNGWDVAQTIDYAGRVQKYPNTKYYVRAYASVNTPDTDNNLDDIIYSSTQTEFITLPAMQTDDASNITDVSATLGGTILSRDINGYLYGGTYGICWGTSPNPTKGTGNYVEETINDSLGNTRPYTLNATGLSQNTTYHYRAYYYKGSEIAYANQAETTFTTKQHHLAVNWTPAEGGTVTPTMAGMNEGEYIYVTATPNTGYEVTGWTTTSGTISGTNPVTFTMGNNNATLTANFALSEYTITVQASPAVGGTVTGGGSTFHYGATANLNASASAGYTFSNWTLNGEIVSEDASFSITVTGDATYVANFAPNAYTLTVTAEPTTTAGTFTVNGTAYNDPVSVNYNSSVTLTATAATGYTFDHWSLNGTTVSSTAEFTFPYTTVGDAEYVAHFNTRSTSGSVGSTSPRPRDIYPAPAREPWNWEEEPLCASPSQRGQGGVNTTAHAGILISPTPLEGGVGDTIRDDDPPVLPKVSTGDITVIDATSATCTGKVTTNGSGTITKYGVCWGTSINPTISDNKTEVTVTTEVAPFDIAAQTMSGLEGSVPYYVRAYATDENGTAYGANKVLIISDPVSIPSIDHNVAEQGRGGGIFLNRKDKNDPAYPRCDSAMLIFSDGNINYNYAKLSGGGIHIDTSAYMQMKGQCEVNANRVDEGSKGGGVYQAGRLYVGEGLNDAESVHTLRINKNFAIGTADNDGGLITNYKAVVAFSVSDGDLAKACGLTGDNAIETLLDMKLGDATSLSGSPTVLTQLLILANAITRETGIVAQDIVNALGLADENALKDLKVSEYNAAKSTLINAAVAGLNNIYLPRDSYDFEDHQAYGTYDDHSSVIVVLSNLSAKNTITEANNVQYPYTNLGFSVPHGYCPVIATSDGFGNKYKNTQQTIQDPNYEALLNALMPVGTLSLKDCAVFEDSDSYIAIHTRKNNDPFLGKYIYLWGSWTNPKVDEDPEIYNPMAGEGGGGEWLHHYKILNPGDNTNENNKPLEWEIYSPEGLSWFSSYVNGLNAFKDGLDGIHKQYNPAKNPYAKAKLMNDLDMRDALWVPIGSVTFYHGPSGDGGVYSDEYNRSFKGEFDGQGHLVTGLDCRYLTGIENYGFFGRLEGDAKVKNLFIDDSKFHTISNELGYCVGGVSGQMSGNATVSASEARAEINVIESKKSETYVGGIAGKVEGTNTIHSSMAMPNISGSAKYVGGLVGYLGSGNNLFNSFSNPKFPDAKYADTIRTGVSTITDSIYFGGLVGINNGTVENCYSRLQGTEPIGDGKQTGKSIFGWLAGTNTGTIQYSYALQPSPEATRIYVRKTTSPGNNAPSGHGTYGPTTLYSGKYGFKHRDQQMTAVTPADATYISNTLNDTLIVGGLTNTLNAWVEAKNGATGSTRTYHPWMRTMASPINDDYPIPNFLNQSTTTPAVLSDNEDPLWNCVGSIDKVFMIYDKDVNNLYYDRDFDTVSFLYHPNAAMYLYNTNDGIVRISGNPLVPLYIHEDVGIAQEGSNALTARVGVTFDNTNRSTSLELGGQPYDWHMFSSALCEPAMGLRYHTDEEANEDETHYHIWKNYTTGGNYYANGIPNNIYNGQVPGHNRDYMDPPRTYFYQTDDDNKVKSYTTDRSKIGYFPANTPYGSWRAYNNAATIAAEDGLPAGSFDFYMYGEAYYQHWINFKRRGDDDFFDHWRQDETDGVHLNIPYPNETQMVNGRGYMMGVSQRSMLMADGILNNGEVSYSATFTVDLSATVYDALVRGTNLIGNPFQSYLDFDLFAVGVKDGPNVTEPSPNNGKIKGDTYYVFDADNGGYISYTAYSSDNPTVSAPSFIHPHQGFFVKVASPQELKFKNNMRVAGKWKSTLTDADDLYGSYYRGKLNYPLVNLFCYNSEGKRDVTTVEINRPDVGGGYKMKGLLDGKMLIYARWDNTDYQTAFTPEGISEVPVRFEAFEDDVFTMRWSTLHGDFHYLHLIDNLAGTDIDMLRAEEYHFEGRTTDYLSRFKIVFEVTGVEEHEEDELDNGSISHFAFRMGDELIVNGAGYLEVFDVQGRRLTAKRLAGAQSSVSLPNVAAGVYLLRLTGDKQVKTQKMVISY